jgi:carbamoyl-phosphate synthase large subunit
MTGAGAPGGPGILRCLQVDKSLDIVVADKNPHAVGKYLNGNGTFWEIPDAKSPNFIEYVLNKCISNGIDVILPLVTLELFQFSQYKALFAKNGIKVIVSDYQYLEIANNKSALVAHLAKNGIITPDYRIVPTGDFELLLKAFKELDYPQRPLCFKPSISNGSRGVRIVDDRIDKFDLLFTQKPNTLYMTFDEMQSILRGAPFPELLLTEVLPGEEYTIDTIVNNGNVELVIPRIRTRTIGGISVEGQFIRHEPIIEYCKAILNTMNLHGPIGLQVKKSIDGHFKILEINPRIQGTSVAALALGVNLPLESVNQEIGKKCLIEEQRLKWGVHFIRYWQEVFYE